MATVADASAGASCATAFHTALTTIREGRSASLSGLQRRLAQADVSLPGRWHFSVKPASARTSENASGQRVCVSEIVRAGRVRCERFADRAAVAVADASTTNAVSEREQTLLAFLTPFVEAKAALGEFGPNGKLGWTVTKAAVDLRGYVAQAEHPALCSGVPEMLTFYDHELRSVRRRADTVAEQVTNARGLLRERLQAWTAAGGSMVAGVRDDAAPLALIKALGDSVLDTDAADALAVEPEAVAALGSFATAQRQGQTKPLAPQLSRATVDLVRALEILAYADLMDGRYRQLDHALFGTSAAIRAAHEKVCRCAP
jgi:hypothetical protein